MKLKFSKMHGLGNDFMVIDAINQPFTPEPEVIRGWANRFDGVGFDQMLIVEPAASDQAAFKYRIFNADGGEVSQCGNGARCFARFVREQNMTDLDVIRVETNAGLLQLQMIDASRVLVNMGVPLFEPAQIPLAIETRLPLYTLSSGEAELRFSALSIGNPHMVIQVEDIDIAPVADLGPLLESHKLFPARVNVGFMQVLDRQHFKLRVFERGVGETRACGSGACAAHVSACQLGIIDNKAIAHLIGGDLNLEWQGEENPVMMTGETAMVFHGEIEYEQRL